MKSKKYFFLLRLYKKKSDYSPVWHVCAIYYHNPTNYPSTSMPITRTQKSYSSPKYLV